MPEMMGIAVSGVAEVLVCRSPDIGEKSGTSGVYLTRIWADSGAPCLTRYKVPLQGLRDLVVGPVLIRDTTRMRY